MKKNDVSNTNTHMGPVYARFFSSTVLKELARKGHSEIASRMALHYSLIEDFGPSMKLRDFYDAIFHKLAREYRHEYIYKNAIAEKILLGRHNLKTAFMLTEFRADNCKADALVLNGTSHVYEIKSEMDSFERLDRQLAAYQKMFDCITVITTEHLYNAVYDRIPKEIGILVLANDNYQFRKTPYRKATSNLKNVDPIIIFNSLQRHEYIRIIKEEFGISLANFPNTKVYSQAKEYFKKLTPETAHSAMVKMLKCRRDSMGIANFVPYYPNSLKVASLSIRLAKNDRERFINLLDKEISSTFAPQN